MAGARKVAAARTSALFLLSIRAQGFAGARFRKVKTETEMLRVLCVDDEVHVLSMVADTLGAQGHDVQTAVDGAHALQKIATAEPPYHLLIVDGRMPNLDGWGLILAARTGGYKGRVIVFSAYLDVDERQRYRQLKIDYVIEKPPRAGELVQAVQEIAATVS
jgi:two-component system KDP operon response regulator KdpE